jgi:hypothetical protein
MGTPSEAQFFFSFHTATRTIKARRGRPQQRRSACVWRGKRREKFQKLSYRVEEIIRAKLNRETVIQKEVGSLKMCEDEPLLCPYLFILIDRCRLAGSVVFLFAI